MRKTCSPDGGTCVTFRVPVWLEAHTACVVGSFNGWTPDRHRLLLLPSGDFELQLELPSGRHEFRYLLDGERWVNDPDAEDFVLNAFGGQNAVVDIAGWGRRRRRPTAR